jgi:hypothetical protein
MNIRQLKARRRELLEAAQIALKGKRFAEARRAAHRAEVLDNLLKIKRELASC